MNKDIKKTITRLPFALQEQVLVRFGMGFVLGILSLGIILYTKMWILGIPSLILMFFMIVNSLHLLYNCSKDRYIAVTGKCVEMERTGAKKGIKSLCMATEDGVMRVFVSNRWRVPSVEDLITVYLPAEAPVYEVDGRYCIYYFYALEINRKV